MIQCISCTSIYTKPSTLADLEGIRRIHKEALPLHKQMESLWNKWEVQEIRIDRVYRAAAHAHA
jgi:hypothetical protein